MAVSYTFARHADRLHLRSK